MSDSSRLHAFQGRRMLTAAVGAGVVRGGLREESPAASTPAASDAATSRLRQPPAAPVINSFTAEPSTVEAGQSSTLRWSITGATDMSIDHGVGAVQSSGQRQVFPRASTSYTLTARGPGGMDSRSVTVEVSSAPPPPPPPLAARRVSPAPTCCSSRRRTLSSIST